MHKYEVKAVTYLSTRETSKVFKIWHKLSVTSENNVTKFKFKLNGIFFTSTTRMTKLENTALVTAKPI